MRGAQEVVGKGIQYKLATAFAHTFERLNAGTNPAVRQRSDGRPRFLTPARPADEDAPPPLFPGPGLVSLHEALHTVNQQSRFTECLQHWSPRNRPPCPAERVFFAGVMAYGCNLGLTRMAHATKHVEQSTLEYTHQFARAVFYGQNDQFRYAGKEEQQLADACKRLVQNVIVCWNCLYLNQQLFQAPPAERQALADATARVSPVSWQHINLQGEFDFSNEVITDALRCDLGALLTVEWEPAED